MEESMNEYEKNQHCGIQAWKSQKPSIIDNAIGVAFTPVTWVVGRVVPTSAIEGALHASDWIAQQTIPSSGSAQ
ncbi:hypothetical protein JL101_006865 [Skermanella rosea]|uniref:hypothetical protein n=1 Tax=Skermanella rosea TaxID=1817965 RepID=UPI001E5EF04D|nr:hypothetical protein [Skermanella rosea]UEM05152.1 hypothetical protein JL101_006865 [Skermanella rosea]